MDPQKPDDRISVRAAPPTPAGSAPPAARRKPPAPVSRQYMDDHPILIPALTLALGGLCLYATLFTTLLRDLQLGSNSQAGNVGAFNGMIGYVDAFVLALMFLSLIFLGIHGVDRAVHRLRRRPRVCPHCAAAEGGATRFPAAPVAGTAWADVTCPACGHHWYGKTECGMRNAEW